MPISSATFRIAPLVEGVPETRQMRAPANAEDRSQAPQVRHAATAYRVFRIAKPAFNPAGYQLIAKKP
jgi:hypothetical protein